MNLDPFRYPAEWEPHDAVWLAWPSHQEPWESTPLAAVQEEFVLLCRAIADPDPETGAPRGEALRILVPDRPREAEASKALKGLRARFHLIPFGDIWVRDTAPIFVHSGPARVASSYRFNGWGGKFVYPDDDQVASAVARASGDRSVSCDWILEGGSLDSDGEGTLLTTEECLLNPNRNPGLQRGEIEERLRRELGFEKVLWLKRGLEHDHTDGHIDNLARFVGPAHVVCMEATGPNDPNAAVLGETAAQLRAMEDARGRPLQVTTIPSPGEVRDRTGNRMAASHVNFYIGNATVVVPVYPGTDPEAVLAPLRRLFPGRRVVASPAWNILHGGGSFHCITQQVPSKPSQSP